MGLAPGSSAAPPLPPAGLRRLSKCGCLLSPGVRPHEVVTAPTAVSALAEEAPRKREAVQGAPPSRKGVPVALSQGAPLKELRGIRLSPGSQQPRGTKEKGAFQGPKLRLPAGMGFHVSTRSFPRWVLERVILAWAGEALPSSGCPEEQRRTR